MEVDREIEMMLCMNHQDYAVCLDGKTISFPLECMIDMWDILKEDGELFALEWGQDLIAKRTMEIKFRKLTEDDKERIDKALDNLNKSIRNYKSIMDELKRWEKRT